MNKENINDNAVLGSVMSKRRSHLKSQIIGAILLATGAFGFSPNVAKAYPIDCAIFLCLAGGWPASAECAAAKAEFIRRITPFPIEPPLQLWRCPMSSGPGNTAPIDYGSPEFSFLRAFRMYHIQYTGAYWERGSCYNAPGDGTQLGSYDEEGQFSWTPFPYASTPSWVSKPAIECGLVDKRGIAIEYQSYEGEWETLWQPY